MVNASGPLTSADLDALDGPLRSLLATAKVRTGVTRDINEAARLSVGELRVAKAATDVSAGLVRFAARLGPLAGAFRDAAAEYVAALGAVDVALRALLMRAADQGVEPADKDEIVDGLVVLTRIADIGRGQLEGLDGLAGGYPYPPLQQALATIVEAITQMEQFRLVLDEWQRLILQIKASG